MITGECDVVGFGDGLGTGVNGNEGEAVGVGGSAEVARGSAAGPGASWRGELSVYPSGGEVKNGVAGLVDYVARLRCRGDTLNVLPDPFLPRS